MKIQCLLEAEAFRFQREWSGISDPVINMKGRTHRESSSSPFEAYALAYGMELNNKECPRRWRSTFATTNPDQSHYMKYEGGKDGLRKLILPPNTKVGSVANDFNYMPAFVPEIRGMTSSIGDIRVTVSEMTKKPDANPNLLKLLARVISLSKSIHSMFGGIASDEGYEQFKQIVDNYDRIIMLPFIPNSAIPDEILGFGAMKACIQDRIENVIDVGRVEVFDSLEDVPSDHGREIWFEGDYQAVPLSS